MTDLLPAASTDLERAADRALARLDRVPVPIGDLWRPETCPAEALPFEALLDAGIGQDHLDRGGAVAGRVHLGDRQAAALVDQGGQALGVGGCLAGADGRAGEGERLADQRAGEDLSAGAGQDQAGEVSHVRVSRWSGSGRCAPGRRRAGRPGPRRAPGWPGAGSGGCRCGRRRRRPGAPGAAWGRGAVGSRAGCRCGRPGPASAAQWRCGPPVRRPGASARASPL
ncbi:phage tail protein I [Rhodothalassium salexigens]|nr:phage tail protein I [Rhodothalassium salexigens]MBK5920741.1 phage tail protein I [Rhodothalassium salexigens]